MYQQSSSEARTGGPTEEQTRGESPLPDVPFMGIAAFLGFLVLVLIAAAAYSLAEVLPTINVTPAMLAPAVFMLLVFGVFWAIDRYQPRTHTR